MPRHATLALVARPALDPLPDPPGWHGEPLPNPGRGLKPKKLDRTVVTCRSAARAKRVPLEHELKSLLITSDRGFVIAHVRGNRRLSLRAVKNELGVRHARLANPSDLEKFDVSRGTLYPFKDAIWAAEQLISEEVLDLKWVTTNYGTRDEYVEFDPALLLRAAHRRVGNFEE